MYVCTPDNVLLVLRTTTRVYVYCLLGTPYCLLMWAYSSTATPGPTTCTYTPRRTKKKVCAPKILFPFCRTFPRGRTSFRIGSTVRC